MSQKGERSSLESSTGKPKRRKRWVAVVVVALVVGILFGYGVGYQQLQSSNKSFALERQQFLDQIDTLHADLSQLQARLAAEEVKQPKMTLAEVTLLSVRPVSFGCSGLFPTQGEQTYSFEFSIFNTGSGDGFATIGVLIDGKTHATQKYFIAANSKITRSTSTIVNDCDDHAFNLRILSTE